MNYRIACIMLPVVLLVATACKKDPAPPAPPSKALLSVKLDQPYLTTTQVDSAFAIWKTNGQEQRIKLIISNDSLLAETAVFNEGNGELTLHIYSNKKYRNQYPGEWVSHKNISIHKTKAVSYTGPASFYDAAWFPRVDLKDAIGHRAIIALRPDDAYFLVKDPGHALFKLVVARGYWNTTGGVHYIGGNTWECNTQCTGVANEEFFSTLPQRIGNKAWNHISVTILFSTDGNGGWLLTLEHEP
ncbi:MAG: hypothetical protein JNN00_19025 [Chitinophagaceae bacterium]|nr:hypothetical protein [Chitinophagaceae bacterium]